MYLHRGIWHVRGAGIRRVRYACTGTIRGYGTGVCFTVCGTGIRGYGGGRVWAWGYGTGVRRTGTVYPRYLFLETVVLFPKCGALTTTLSENRCGVACNHGAVVALVDFLFSFFKSQFADMPA